MEIEDIMKKPVVTSKDISLYDAAKLMTKNKIKYILFVSDEKAIGIITSDDLIKHFGENVMLSSVMSKKIISIKKDDKIQKAIDLMRDNNISVLPVNDNSGKLVGIIHSENMFYEVCENEEFLVD